MAPTDFFQERVETLQVTRLTRAYISGLFTTQLRADRAVDFSDQSVLKTYIEVRHSLDLERAQKIGDWTLWMLSWFPAHVTGYRELAESLGRLSYWRCYRLVPSWRVYEELADRLPVVTRQLSANAP